jgi:beta-glucosidase
MFGDYSYPAHIELLMGEIPDLYMGIPSVLDGIRRHVSPETVLHHAKGCEVNGGSRKGFEAAIEAAKRSAVAVLVVGGKSGLTLDCTCGEFRDRAEIGLPGVQEELIQAVYETGTPVVVVLINGRPFSIPWIVEHIPAILEAWLPGQEGGVAVADVLFGDYNPGGRLPITFPRSVGQIPIYYNRKPSGGRSQWYGDYVSMSAKPIFPFGHGLSYTRFEYEDLRINPKKTGIEGDVEISVDVKNVGEQRGDEVVQLYIHDVLASVTRPVKELKGFKRITLNPLQKETVTFTLSICELGFYDRNMAFMVEPGWIDIMVGGSSDDVRLTQRLEIVGDRNGKGLAGKSN